MSHFQNVFGFKRGKTLESETNKETKLKSFGNSIKKVNNSPKIGKSNQLNLNHNINDKPKERTSLKKVALGLQNFISKVLVDNSNDTKYFNVKEELDEIQKAKEETKKQKDFFHIKDNNNNEFNRFLTITYDSEKPKKSSISNKQIGLGFFKTYKKNNQNKLKILRTMTSDNINKFQNVKNENSFSSTNNFLSPSEKISSYINSSNNSNLVNNEPFNPFIKDFYKKLRKNSYDVKINNNNNIINLLNSSTENKNEVNKKKITKEESKNNINKFSSSLKMSLNSLRNAIESNIHVKANINEKNQLKFNSKDNDISNIKNKSYENINFKNSMNKNPLNNITFTVSEKNLNKKKVNFNENHINLKPKTYDNNVGKTNSAHFSRRKGKEKSQIINKWLLYSKIMALNPTKNELVNFNNNIRQSKRKRFQTINPITPQKLEKEIKSIKQKQIGIHRHSSLNNVSQKIYEEHSPLVQLGLNRHFSKNKFKTKNNITNKRKLSANNLLFKPRKSKTSFLEEEKNNDENILNVKSLRKNILQQEYKSIPMDTNISIAEHKTYLEEGVDKSEIGSLNFDLENVKETRYRMLMRSNKLVYDSLSDEESDEVYEDTDYISPNSKFIFFFDMTIFFFSFYSFCVNPIILCFYSKFIFTFLFWFNIINILIDLIYITDLVLGFFTAYYDIEERYIKKLSEISFHYLTSWFIIDLLSAIPFQSIFNLINRNKGEYFYSYSGDFKLYELWEIFRLFKIYKAICKNEFFHYLMKSLSQYEGVQKNFILMFYTLIVILHGHFFACINIFLSNLDYPNWVTVQNLQNSPKTDIYIASFYYIFSTVTTVGYGDIVSINIYERFNNLILLVVGIVVYSYCVSALSNYVQQVDSKTLDYQEKSETLEQIRLNHEKMPQELYEKILRFLRYRLTNESKDQNDLIDNLPISLRSTLIMEMYKPIIQNFIFFKTFNSSDFIIKVIMAFRPILSLKNEKLVNEGDYIEEIVFVKRGALALELPLPIYISDKEIEGYMTKKTTSNFTQFEFNRNPTHKRFSNERPVVLNFNDKPSSTLTFIRGKGLTKVNTTNNNESKKNIHVQQYVKIIEIRKNEHFGDILMFLNKRSPLSMKVKTKYAELFLLNKTDAVEISMSFPKIWSQIIKKSLFNMEQIERLINKTLKFFYMQNDKGGKRSSYYLRDINNKDTLINYTNYYNNLNEEDYELQSIPSSSTENVFENSEKNNALDIITSSESETSSKFSNDSGKNNSELSSSKTQKNSSHSEDNNNKDFKVIHLKPMNDKNEKEKLKSSNKNYLFLKSENRTIKEEISDEENENTIIKNSLIKSSKISKLSDIKDKSGDLREKVSEIKEESSFNHEIFSSSDLKDSGTGSKTKKETNDGNLIDFNSLSSKNNTLVYPYSKSEINNEEFPFETSTSAIENNNNIINNIVPKIKDIFGKPETLIESKFTRENSLTVSSFSIEIESNKKSDNINTYEKYIVVKNEFFSIHCQNMNNNKHFYYKKYKSDNNLILISDEEKKINQKSKNPNEEEKFIQTLGTNFIRNNNKTINKTFKERTKVRRFSKMLIDPDSLLETDKLNVNPNVIPSTFFSNNKKNDTSKQTLNLIGKNIESNSLALNNPKMFYQNYFSNVVQRTSPRKSVVIRLKDIENIIKNNKTGNNNNSNNNTRNSILKIPKRVRHGSLEFRETNLKKDGT